MSPSQTWWGHRNPYTCSCKHVPFPDMVRAPQPPSPAPVGMFPSQTWWKQSGSCISRVWEKITMILTRMALGLWPQWNDNNSKEWPITLCVTQNVLPCLNAHISVKSFDLLSLMAWLILGLSAMNKLFVKGTAASFPSSCNINRKAVSFMVVNCGCFMEFAFFPPNHYFIHFIC